MRDKEPDTVRNRDKEREKLTFILTGSLALDSIVDPDEATLTRVAGHVAEILTEVVVTRRTPRETGTICHRVVKRSFVPLQITFMAICNYELSADKCFRLKKAECFSMGDKVYK